MIIYIYLNLIAINTAFFKSNKTAGQWELVHTTGSSPEGSESEAKDDIPNAIDDNDLHPGRKCLYSYLHSIINLTATLNRE